MKEKVKDFNKKGKKDEYERRTGKKLSRKNWMNKKEKKYLKERKK